MSNGITCSYEPIGTMARSLPSVEVVKSNNRLGSNLEAKTFLMENLSTPGFCHPKNVALAALGEHRDLCVVATEEVQGAGRNPTRQHRPSNDPILARLELAPAVSSLRQAPWRVRNRRGCSTWGPPKATTRSVHNEPVAKSLPTGHHVLVANVPDGLGRPDRIEKVDVGARQSRGMRTGKFDDLGTVG